MQKELRLELVLKKHNPELKLFLNKFSQLMKNNEKFILGWHSGNKLFIIPCNANSVEKNYFISLTDSMRKENVNYVSIINSGISLHADVRIEIINNIVKFTITSNEACKDKFPILEKLYSDLVVK